MKALFRVALFAPIFLFASSCATKKGDASASNEAVKPYPFETCAVIDVPLDAMGNGGPFTKVYGDQEVKFCCKPCIKTFETAPVVFLAKIDRYRETGEKPAVMPVAKLPPEVSAAATAE